MCSTFVFLKEQGVSNDDDVDHVAVAVHCTGSVVVAAMEGLGLGLDFLEESKFLHPSF